jgi:hypothetical protein
MKYGIEEGQVYISCSGETVKVVDCETYSWCDDVVVECLTRGVIYRIDAFKLAMVRYSLLEGGEE